MRTAGGCRAVGQEGVRVLRSIRAGVLRRHYLYGAEHYVRLWLCNLQSLWLTGQCVLSRQPVHFRLHLREGHLLWGIERPMLRRQHMHRGHPVHSGKLHGLWRPRASMLFFRRRLFRRGRV